MPARSACCCIAARELFAELLLDEVAESLASGSLDEAEQELIDLELHEYCRPALEKRRETSASEAMEPHSVVKKAVRDQTETSHAELRNARSVLPSRTKADVSATSAENGDTINQRRASRALPMSCWPIRDRFAASSDVVLAESETAPAPSFRARIAAAPMSPTAPPAPRSSFKPSKKRRGRDKAPMALLPGAKVDDFEIVRLLGRGAFGHVYLARQMSLDRQVALKISANRGSEGRTMARLEHQHIVQVFSEKVDPEFNQRLLCMQLVPGVGLDKLIGMLHTQAGTAGPQAAAGSLPAASPTPLGPAPNCSASSTAPARCPRRSIRPPCTIAKRSARWMPSKPRPGSAAGWPKRSTSPIDTACCTATSSRPTSS